VQSLGRIAFSLGLGVPFGFLVFLGASVGSYLAAGADGSWGGPIVIPLGTLLGLMASVAAYSFLEPPAKKA